MAELELRLAETDEERQWLEALWQKEWGGTTMITRGRSTALADVQAVIAYSGGEPVGAVTWRMDEQDAELMSLNAFREGQGIGGALLARAEQEVKSMGTTRLYLITTNDNLHALAFYQKRGYRLVRLFPGAVDAARRMKPTIPVIGHHGIPLRDELELAKAW
ncbi:acetyltransferase [Thermoactinomyces vulgaris]|jgi:ribosomal protein S18 acetylase RimI-like enzyme|nr:acetyltransferase [Thermoactinomyces vulgaris]